MAGYKYRLGDEYMTSLDIARKLGYLSREVFRVRARKNGTDMQTEIDREYEAQKQGRSLNRHRELCYQVHGETMCLTQMAEISGVKLNTLYYRIVREGMTPEEAMQPKRKRRMYALNGQEMSTAEIAGALYLEFKSFRERARRNGTTVQAEIDAEWERQHGR